MLRRIGLGAAAAVGGAFLLLNLVAFFHAWSMLHYAGRGVRTPPPERLTRLDKARVILVGVALPRPQLSRVPADVGLVSTTHRFSTADGLQLEAWWVVHRAARGVVLLFHGYGDRGGPLRSDPERDPQPLRLDGPAVVPVG